MLHYWCIQLECKSSKMVFVLQCFVEVRIFWVVLENCISRFDYSPYCEPKGTFKSEAWLVTHICVTLWDYYRMYIVIIGYMSQYRGLLYPDFKLHRYKNFLFLSFLMFKEENLQEEVNKIFACVLCFHATLFLSVNLSYFYFTIC